MRPSRGLRAPRPPGACAWRPSSRAARHTRRSGASSRLRGSAPAGEDAALSPPTAPRDVKIHRCSPTCARPLQLAPSAGCGLASYPHGRRRGSPSRHGEIRPEGGPVSLRAGRTTRPRRSLRLDHAPTSLTHQTGRGRQRRGQDHLLLAPRTPAVSRRPFRRRFDRGPAENACVDLSRGGCFAWCPPEVSRPAGSVARTSFPV